MASSSSSITAEMAAAAAAVAVSPSKAEVSAADSEKILVDVSVAVFASSEDGNLVSTDGGKSRMVIGDKNGKFRIVALSSTQQYVINTWIRRDSDLVAGNAAEQPRPNACTFTTRPGPKGKRYVLEFKSATALQRFVTECKACIGRLSGLSPSPSASGILA